MSFSVVNRQGTLILRLEGAVKIRDARDLAAKLLEDGGDAVAVVVDVRDLNDVDTCILQLLCSLRKNVPSIRFDNASEAFSLAVDRCGLRRELLNGRESV